MKEKEYDDIEKEIDIQAFKDSIESTFIEVCDPRANDNITYPFLSVLVIILCGMLAGANSIQGIADYALAKQSFLTSLLSIPHIPKYDVFWWILVRTKPEELEKAFLDWVEKMPISVKEKLIRIDGKRLRGSTNSFLHFVSAWSSEQGLTLGQVKTEKKSNEIIAIPELLKIIDFKDSIITIDAAGCQRKITERIIDGEGDYIIALKGNQETLHDEVINLFTQLEGSQSEKIEGFDFCTGYDKGHGRIEERTVLAMSDLSWLEQKERWKGLQTVIGVIAKRTVGEKTSEERRYYISSLGNDSQRLGRIIRSHWDIENAYHWILDVTFSEDAVVNDTGNAAENLAIFRRLSLNILKQDTDKKMSIAGKRRTAGWNDDYMQQLLDKINVKEI